MEPRHSRLFRLMLWSLFKRAKLRERTEKANRWAESHKRQTAVMTVGSLFLMLVLGTAMKQKQAMDENGFYSDIISSSAVCTIICDSINLDEHERKFTYYGTQLIKRRSRDLKRSIITVGELDNVPRTENNPHGLLIVNWRTLENKDLDY